MTSVYNTENDICMLAIDKLEDLTSLAPQPTGQQIEFNLNGVHFTGWIGSRQMTVLGNGIEHEWVWSRARNSWVFLDSTCFV